MWHGRHWPREEQTANAFEEFGLHLLGNEDSAARLRAAWAPMLPPFTSSDDPVRAEFNNVGRERDARQQEVC